MVEKKSDASNFSPPVRSLENDWRSKRFLALSSSWRENQSQAIVAVLVRLAENSCLKNRSRLYLVIMAKGSFKQLWLFSTLGGKHISPTTCYQLVCRWSLINTKWTDPDAFTFWLGVLNHRIMPLRLTNSCGKKVYTGVIWRACARLHPWILVGTRQSRDKKNEELKKYALRLTNSCGTKVYTGYTFSLIRVRTLVHEFQWKDDRVTSPRGK